VTRRRRRGTERRRGEEKWTVSIAPTTTAITVIQKSIKTFLY